MSTSVKTGQRTEVKLAGSENKDKMYEPKHKKKLVRVLTVVAYVFSVSLAAITLSLFYIFIYNPDRPAGKLAATKLHFTNTTNFHDENMTPEEPRALPVQIVEPVPIAEDNLARINSEEGNGRNWENHDAFKALIDKRAIKKIAKGLKVT